MSAGGEKRQRDSQTGSEDESPATPTSGFGFVFRPSPLTQAASNLATYNRSSNAPGKAKIGEPILSLGFSKPQLGSPHSPKPLSINGVSPPGAAGFKRKLDSSSSSDSLATPTKKSNLFIQCMEEKGSVSQEVSGEGEGTSEGGGFIFGQELASRATNTTVKSGWGVAQSDQTTPPKDLAKDLTGKDTGTAAGAGAGAGGSLPAFSGQPSPSLPEVEKITGEEGERHVIQISCKLFVYDREARLWKERGRGELRLNDSPQSEGVYQSRLVMRATGSYRVLLNTNVWNGMNCERASPQSLRITAQESGGQFGIYLIKGALKDIHALFTSLDQRLQALRRSFSSSSSSSSKDQLPPPILSPPLPIEKEREEREGEKVRGASFDEDSLVGDRNSAHSSPDSSPERHRERLRVSKETLATPSSSESNDFMEGEEGRETTPTNLLLKSSAETKKDMPTDS